MELSRPERLRLATVAVGGWVFWGLALVVQCAGLSTGSWVLSFEFWPQTAAGSLATVSLALFVIAYAGSRRHRDETGQRPAAYVMSTQGLFALLASVLGMWLFYELTTELGA